MFGLNLFRRTSTRRCVNLATFHSPHSLTWSWILSAEVAKVHATPANFSRNPIGFGGGLGNLLSLVSYTTNGGRQVIASVAGLTFRWSRQQPMYYRDMIGRAWSEREEAVADRWRVQEELATLRHNAARANPQTVPNHLH